VSGAPRKTRSVRVSCLVILPFCIALPSVLGRVLIHCPLLTTLPGQPPSTASQVAAPHEASHSGLLEPRGSSTVRNEPGVRDRTTLSVMP